MLPIHLFWSLRCLLELHRWHHFYDGDTWARGCRRCGAVDHWEVVRGSRDQYAWHPAYYGDNS